MEQSSKVRNFGERTIGETPTSNLVVENSCPDRQDIKVGAFGDGFVLAGTETVRTIEAGESTRWHFSFEPDRVREYEHVLEVSATEGFGVAVNEVHLLGVGRSCPTAKIVGPASPDITRAHELSSEESVVATGRSFAAYEWSVQRAPNGSSPEFSPSASVANPLVTFPAAGEYEIHLELVDSAGERSCEPARYLVTAR